MQESRSVSEEDVDDPEEIASVEDLSEPDLDEDDIGVLDQTSEGGKSGKSAHTSIEEEICLEEPSVLNTESFASFDEMLGIQKCEDQTRKRKLNMELEEQFNNIPSKISKDNDDEDNNEDDEVSVVESIDAPSTSTTGEGEAEYYYFCLDCESHSPRAGCSHLTHPRVPLGMDIAGHLAATGHMNLQPIRNFVLPIRRNRMLRIRNLSYTAQWGARVRKCWKKLVLAGNGNLPLFYVSL